MPHPKGGYRLKNGERVPGVTTIIGRFKDSGGLLWWAFEMGKLAEQGVINSLYDRRDEAGESGTLAHQMVENHIHGLDPYKFDKIYPNEIIDKAEQGYKNFLHFISMSKLEFVETEVELVSEKYKYGGCNDSIVKGPDGRLAIGDFKTSNAVYPDMIIQLAAYDNLWTENKPDQPLDGGYHLFRFSKEHADFTHHYWSEIDDAWEQFKLFRKAYDIDKKLKKRV